MQKHDTPKGGMGRPNPNGSPDRVGTFARTSAKCVFIGIALLAVSACALPRGAALTSEIVNQDEAKAAAYQVVPVGRENMPLIASWPSAGTGASYSWPRATQGSTSPVIQPGDRVSLSVWDSQEDSLLTKADQKSVDMNGVTVSSEGSVFVPYVGDVTIKGQTPSQARSHLQNKLASMVPSAQVQLELMPGQNSSVSLVSGVTRPGSFPLPDRNYRMLSLIAEGGGVSPTLRNPMVRLQRSSTTYNIRAERLFENSSHNIALRGGDSVMVLEDQRYFTAFGATGTESLAYFEQEQITALEALSIIGGLSKSRANPKGVLVLRDYEQKSVRQDGTGPGKAQVVFAFDMTSADGLFAARKFQIQPKDTVMATESAVTSVRTVLGLVGSVFGAASSVRDY